ncbi:hypothetical protein F0562_026943 [Nyssa sinensis]|uniref:UBA domain-containing protein n=1 Tax=Nyssa sinensis TaxID=561372 RepID=A0A5J5B436_9ASTE|nr:hypothetical protein F0562_026943 [Nyssa sinensis]
MSEAFRRAQGKQSEGYDYAPGTALLENNATSDRDRQEGDIDREDDDDGLRLNRPICFVSFLFQEYNLEQQKASSKLTGSTNTGNGSPASAYNPISGTFHTLDTAPMSSYTPLHNNGRFRNIEETDEHSGSSQGTAPEYDSVSNNGSCSGESEDHKEKTAGTPPRQETIPGSDNDKREKIRQKNERKHQRQRERRAQELHERCSGYLMSRKLEALSQQLMAMGFSAERATLALMLNEGRVEESVSWLFEGSEEAQKKDLGSGVNLKIDIS